MTKSAGLYQILGAQNVHELTNRLNFLLANISDRLDKIEGLRGTSEIASDLALAGDANIASNVAVSGDSAVTGDSAVGGASTVTGNALVGGDLTAQSTTDLQGDTLLAGHMRVFTVDSAEELVTETVSFEGSGLCAGNMEVGGDVTVAQDLTVSGDLTANNIFRTGMILLWSGSVSSIPLKFSLCDGTNGTPDLRDRFIVGAGSTFAVDDTGGTSNPTTLTTDAPSATTTVDNNADASTVAVGSNTHTHELDVSLTDKYNLIPHYALAYIMFTG